MTQRTSPRCPSVLSIAGSDSGGGAGIQADLKTFAAFGVHGLTAIAALTAQTTRGVRAVHVPPASFLRAQLEDLFADFDIRAAKIGMLADAERIRCVAEVLRQHPQVPVVLDPVMVASSGARLLASEAVEALHVELLPLATVLTPNLPEAEVLLGYRLDPEADLAAAAASLLSAGAEWVLLKGGHLDEGTHVVDRLYGKSASLTYQHPRLALSPHGTGCTLSAAIGACLAAGSSVPEACDQAIRYVHRALQHSYQPGFGDLAALGHFAAASRPV